MAAMISAMAVPESSLASIVSATFAGVGLAIGITTGITIPLWRRKRLRWPFTLEFTDSDWTDPGPSRIAMPPNSEQKIYVRMRMGGPFALGTTSLIVDFSGDSLRKPQVLSREEVSEASPHLLYPGKSDRHGQLHIKETRTYTRSNTYIFAFKIRTRQPGEYPIYFVFESEVGESKAAAPIVLAVLSHAP